MRLFVRDDSIFMIEGQRDVVETFEQALFLMRLDLEMRGPSEIVGHRLLFEIDSEPVCPRSRRPRGKCDRPRQPSALPAENVLHAIVVEDVGELRRDRRAKPASSSAHTACSRELPHPKLLRATKIDAPW